MQSDYEKEKNSNNHFLPLPSSPANILTITQAFHKLFPFSREKTFERFSSSSSSSSPHSVNGGRHGKRSSLPLPTREITRETKCL